jgi:hypothetical protein
LAGGVDDQRQGQQDDAGADEGRKVRIDVRDPDLGKDGGQRENAVAFMSARSGECDRTFRLTILGGQDAPAFWLASARFHALGLEHQNGGW